MDRASLISAFQKTRLDAANYEFDVFLAHNAQDKRAVEAIAARLESKGLKPWFDKWEIAPGRVFQSEIDRVLPKNRSVAVFIGPSGIGPWQQVEIKLAISQFVRRESPVIPILLPDANELPEDLPLFLCEFSWVVFDTSIDDMEAFDRLVFGITGVHPRGSGSATLTTKPGLPSREGPTRPAQPLLEQLSKISPRTKIKELVDRLKGRRKPHLIEPPENADLLSAVFFARPQVDIAEHTLVRRIGEGAYGEVWLARDVLGNYRAAKVIYRARFGNDSAPYEREYRGISAYGPVSLSHPGLLHVLQVGRRDAEGYFYYVMEVGDDIEFGQAIKPKSYATRNLDLDLDARKRLPVGECIEIVAQLAGALDHMHRHGLVHRDIKPSNIVFVKGVPKLADIGLVTPMAAPGRELSLVGTEGYMPPEGPGSPAGDIYGLGIVLYRMCTGQVARQFPALPETLHDCPDCAEVLELIQMIMTACAPEPEKRYRSATDMRTRLLELKHHLLRPPTDTALL